MLASIIISNKLSLAFGKQATKLAGKASFGVLGAGGRHTFGRAFSKLSQSEKLKEWGRGGGITGIGARFALKATRAGANANYDLRGAPGVAAAAKDYGVEIGKPQKGGYEAILKKQVEDRKKFAASLAPDPVIQAGRKQQLVDEKTGIEEQEKDAVAIKSDAGDKVKDIKRRKQILVREGKEYSPEMEALEKELTAAEGEVTNAEKLVKQIGEQKKNVEEKIKEIDDIGKKRAESYATELVSPTVFGLKIPFVSRKNKISSVAIRKGKSEEEKLIEGLSKKMKDKEKKGSKDSSESEEKDKGQE